MYAIIKFLYSFKLYIYVSNTSNYIYIDNYLTDIIKFVIFTRNIFNILYILYCYCIIMYNSK